MDTYKVIIINAQGDMWTPRPMRAQSIVNLRKRLMKIPAYTGKYSKFEITKVGSSKTDLLEQSWGGGFNWYSNISANHRKWDKVSRVDSEGRLI